MILSERKLRQFVKRLNFWGGTGSGVSGPAGPGLGGGAAAGSAPAGPASGGIASAEAGHVANADTGMGGYASIGDALAGVDTTALTTLSSETIAQTVQSMQGFTPSVSVSGTLSALASPVAGALLGGVLSGFSPMGMAYGGLMGLNSSDTIADMGQNVSSMVGGLLGGIVGMGLTGDPLGGFALGSQLGEQAMGDFGEFGGSSGNAGGEGPGDRFGNFGFAEESLRGGGGGGRGSIDRFASLPITKTFADRPRQQEEEEDKGISPTSPFASESVSLRFAKERAKDEAEDFFESLIEGEDENGLERNRWDAQQLF